MDHQIWRVGFYYLGGGGFADYVALDLEVRGLGGMVGLDGDTISAPEWARGRA